MTKAITVAALLLFTVSCNDAKKEDAMEPAADSSAVATAPAGPHEYAVNATFSSDFEIGDYTQADKVVDLWKQYDENTLDKGLDYFADTVTLAMHDGWKYRGTRDSLMKLMKKKRGDYSSINSVIIGIIPLRAKDLKENWVSIFGTEYTTMKNKKDSADIQEYWRFNKDGKIDMMHSFKRKK
jgi:hypothetical protein